MEREDKRSITGTRRKALIIILAVLLAASAICLTVRYIYLGSNAGNSETFTVPNNLIGTGKDLSGQTFAISSGAYDKHGTQSSISECSAGDEPDGSAAVEVSSAANATVIELYDGHAEWNRRFEAENMLPGDIVTEYYCVRVHHDEKVTLYFCTDVTNETKNLGDVLNIRVAQLGTGTILMDAPFKEANGYEAGIQLEVSGQNETDTYYVIEVYLDTSVGNEYQGASLDADFKWYVSDDGALIPPPQTGDSAGHILWIVFTASLVLLAAVTISGRRKKEARHEK